jgi:serine/threonine-protein kinase
MALAAGTRFGAYQVAESIGSGGMGDVYRATDTNLKRAVAIKILPQAFANDADRVMRFQREAEALAALSHPNIAQIHGFERSDGSTALIMELIEGPTLADRIAQGPIPYDEALGIAMQVANALEAAHGRGVVHRDLKPANIKVRPDGVVKVLDFGIATAPESPIATSGRGSPALLTPALTEVGVLLGTAGYMSPEQARGKPVDERADIWAFGCLLYEMLTGQPAFGGEDVTTTLARVLERDADLGQLPTTVAPAVRRTLELCLEKDPRTRIADIRDAKLALEGRFETTRAMRADAGGAAAGWRRALPLAAALAVGGAVVGLAALTIWPEPEPISVTRFVHALPEGQTFAATTNDLIGLSPDGRTLAYSSVGALRLRDMATLEEREIRSDQVIDDPTFSPDGRSIAYLSNGFLVRRSAAAGGPAVAVTDRALRGALSLSWTPDDTILMTEGTGSGIQRVPATGGTPEVFVASAGLTLRWPQLLPDGDTVLFTRYAANTVTSAEIVVQSISTGESAIVVERGARARYVPTGHLVYTQGDTLFGIAFDARTKRTFGGAVPLVEGVAQVAQTAQFELANDGTLAYVRGITTAGTALTLVWVDRTGRKTPLRVPARGYAYLDLSPDETRVALDIRDQESGTWVLDLERETLQRLTFDPGPNRGVAWSADGRRIAFSRQLGDGEEAYWQAADGSGGPEALTRGSGFPAFPVDFTPDGAALLYTTAGLPRRTYMISVGGTAGAGTPLLAGPASEGSPAVSPDGRWLAYASDESGTDEVYVRPFPDVAAGGRWQISSGGGYHPHWSRDSGELFYIERRGAEVAMMAVPFESGETFRPRAAVELFRGEIFAGPLVGPDQYDVSADGQRFLMLEPLPAAETPDVRPDIVIVQNWFEELQRLVPTQ